MAPDFLKTPDWLSRREAAPKVPKLVVSRLDDVVEAAFPTVVSHRDASDAGQDLLSLLEDQTVVKVMLDLADIGYLHSELLSYLVRFQQLLVERGGHVRVCRLAPQAIEVLNITGLSNVLDVCPTRGSALSELRKCSLASQN